MRKLTTLTILLSVALLTFSGCTKIEYLPCPEFDMKTEPPILDLNGTGSMKRVSKDYWMVPHKTVIVVKEFEKKCYEHSADFLSTTKAINAYNKELDKD